MNPRRCTVARNRGRQRSEPGKLLLAAQTLDERDAKLLAVHNLAAIEDVSLHGHAASVVHGRALTYIDHTRPASTAKNITFRIRSVYTVCWQLASSGRDIRGWKTQRTPALQALFYRACEGVVSPEQSSCRAHVSLGKCLPNAPARDRPDFVCYEGNAVHAHAARLAKSCEKRAVAGPLMAEAKVRADHNALGPESILEKFGDESLRRKMREGVVERLHDEAREAAFHDQHGPLVEGGEQAQFFAPEDHGGVRIERERVGRGAQLARERVCDGEKGPMPEVHAVEVSDRDDARLADDGAGKQQEVWRRAHRRHALTRIAQHREQCLTVLAHEVQPEPFDLQQLGFTSRAHRGHALQNFVGENTKRGHAMALGLSFSPAF